MAENKKFDPITILGLAVAVIMLVGGNFYIRSKQAEQQKVWEAQQAAQAEERKREEAAAPKKADPVIATTGTTPATTTGEKPVTPVAAPEPEAVAAPDIEVVGDQLTLMFTAQGANLRKANLNKAFVDTAKQNQLGLEVLGEIEAKKLSMDISRLDIGPADSEKQSERLVFEASSGAQKALGQRTWKLESDSASFDAQGIRTIVYSLALTPQYSLTKTYTIHKSRYYVGLDIAVKNTSSNPISWSYNLVGPAGILLDGPPENPKSSGYVAIRAQLAGRSAPTSGQTLEYPEIVNVDAATAAKTPDKSFISREENLWGTVKNRFFTAMLISRDPGQLNKLSAFEIKNTPDSKDKRLAEPNIGLVGQRKLSAALSPDRSSTPERFALYVGPMNEKQLEQVESELAPTESLYLVEAIQYCDIGGWRWPRVDWIAGKLMLVFRTLSSVFGNYGVAVILLTLLIKLCLHPTQRKATISMNKMQKLQPEIKKLQEKYKGQTSNEAKMKLYQEQQDLFKKAGASPAGGCLPMFIQIPILSALYGIFSHAFEIRGAQFLWIKDLSQPDNLAALTFWPHQLNLLPLIYLCLQLLQMKVAPQTPKSADPQQEMNRKMMSFMPIMFTFMFYVMPSGLMIYFASSAIFSIIEAWYIRKFLIKDPPAGGALKPAGMLA